MRATPEAISGGPADFSNGRHMVRVAAEHQPHTPNKGGKQWHRHPAGTNQLPVWPRLCRRGWITSKRNRERENCPEALVVAPPRPTSKPALCPPGSRPSEATKPESCPTRVRPGRGAGQVAVGVRECASEPCKLGNSRNVGPMTYESNQTPAGRSRVAPVSVSDRTIGR